MKPFLFILCALLATITVNALVRNSLTPQLHSIFDKKASATHVEPFAQASEQWVDDAGPRFGPRRKTGTDLYRHKMAAYTAMAISGGVLVTAGAVLAISLAQENAFTLNEENSFNAFFTFIALALLAGGTAMIVGGILTRRKYARMLGKN
jgi:hypothetical protein